MMIDNILVEEFASLFLSVDRIGPFQERLEQFDFTDENNDPCNLYLMLSKNGRGKTTVMEILSYMMNMLGKDECATIGLEDFDRFQGRAQWDIRVTLKHGSTEETVILSLVAGSLAEDVSLKFWEKSDLEKYGAKSWHRFGFVRNAYGRFSMVGRNDNWSMDFNALIKANIGMRLSGFESEDLTFPTLIYFSAYRNIIRLSSEDRSIVAPRDWNYQPVHFFDIEGLDWRDSLDNLLVWLKWLDDGRFDKAVKTINERVFKTDDKQLNRGKELKGVRKEPPEAVVTAGDQEHRLDRLSSGEKSLVQLYLRLGAHMTRNTILLIDEPEVHLHRNWQYETLYSLRDLARNHFPNVSVVMATHSERIMKAFAPNISEQNLRKGAYIIETIEEENVAREIQEKAIQVRRDVELKEGTDGCH